MATEYFGYIKAFNLRDRDVMLLGQTVKDMQASFENFEPARLVRP